MAFPVVTGTATLPIGVAQLPNYTSDAGALSAPISTEIVKKSFASTVAYLLPQGDSTLFTLTDRMMTEEAAQIEHGFFSKIMVFPSFTVSAAATSGATSLTAYDGSNIIPNGLYMIVGTTTGGSGALSPQVLYSSEVVLVTAVSGNTLTVTRGVGTTAAAIPLDSTLVHIGNAFADASTRPNSFLTKEIRVVNYTQIFRNAWVLSGTMAAIQNVIGDQNPAKGKYECSQYHAMDIEKSIIHGKRSLNMGVAGTSNAFRTMGGIIAQITDSQGSQLFLPGATQASNITTANSKVSGTATAGALSLTDLEAFLDLTTNMSYNPQGAGERFLFVGRVAHVVINQLLRANTQYQLQNGVTQWGLRFTTILFTRSEEHTSELQSH